MKRSIAAAALVLTACGGKQSAPQPKSEPIYFEVDPTSAGSLRGQVRFLGKTPPPRRVSMDAEPACAALHKTAVLEQRIAAGRDGGLANVFVYIKEGLEGKAFRPPQEPVVLDQRGCQFLPRVLGVRAGQTLVIRNSDPVSHNIHPMPKNNRDWNQQQPPQAPDLRRRFQRPEVMIPVKCNVHSWMRSYIGVLDHPYFAVTGADGRFAIDRLPPGDYRVAAWHEVLGEMTERVSISKGETQTVAFSYRSSAAGQ